MSLNISKETLSSETKVSKSRRKTTTVVMLPKKTPSHAFLAALDAVKAMKPK